MEEKKLTFLDHLEELRSRIIESIVVIALSTVLFYFLIPFVLPYVVRPVGKLVFVSPAEAFVSRIKLAFYGGLFLSSPALLVQMWRFLSSGLKREEKQPLAFFVSVSFALFMAGCSLGYFIILPLSLRFLVGFGTDFIVPMITFSHYVSFAGMLVLVFGLVFQMPLVILFLTKAGIVTPEYLKAKRKEAVLTIFILSALFTPPDVVTQVFLAIPMIGLFELSLLFSKRSRR